MSNPACPYKMMQSCRVPRMYLLPTTAVVECTLLLLFIFAAYISTPITSHYYGYPYINPFEYLSTQGSLESFVTCKVFSGASTLASIGQNRNPSLLHFLYQLFRLTGLITERLCAIQSVNHLHIWRLTSEIAEMRSLLPLYPPPLETNPSLRDYHKLQRLRHGIR